MATDWPPGMRACVGCEWGEGEEVGGAYEDGDGLDGSGVA
jgi:hypothetical protein